MINISLEESEWTLLHHAAISHAACVTIGNSFASKAQYQCLVRAIAKLAKELKKATK